MHGNTFYRTKFHSSSLILISPKSKRFIVSNLQVVLLLCSSFCTNLAYSHPYNVSGYYWERCCRCFQRLKHRESAVSINCCCWYATELAKRSCLCNNTLHITKQEKTSNSLYLIGVGETYALRKNVSLLMPVTVAALSKAWIVFARSNTGIVGSNLTWGMDVCVRLFCLCCPVCRWRPWDRLITRPRSLTYGVKDQETETAAKAEQRAVEP
jgi:hypothetical protein